MPRLVNVEKAQKAAEQFNERVAKYYPGDQYHYDIYDENWYAVAVGFFTALELDVFEIDKALEVCREKGYLWKMYPDD